MEIFKYRQKQKSRHFDLKSDYSYRGLYGVQPRGHSIQRYKLIKIDAMSHPHSVWRGWYLVNILIVNTLYLAREKSRHFVIFQVQYASTESRAKLFEAWLTLTIG